MNSLIWFFQNKLKENVTDVIHTTIIYSLISDFNVCYTDPRVEHIIKNMILALLGYNIIIYNIISKYLKTGLEIKFLR